MSKVYIVTSGEYSDYSIAAVFSTRRAAEVYCAVRNQPSTWLDPYGIEEYEMDENVEASNAKVKYRYFVKDVVFKHNKLKAGPPMVMLASNVDQDQKIHELSRIKAKDDYPLRFVYLDEPDAELAEKIVRDRLARFKAEKEGL